MDDDGRLRALLQRVFETAGEGPDVEPIDIDGGASFHVDERADGRWAVVRDDDMPGEPEATFDDRSTAYLAAAVFTAFGHRLPPGPLNAVASAGEMRQPRLGWEGLGQDPAVASRLLAGLMRNRAALELLLQAADPQALEAARRIFLDRVLSDDDTVH